jgi:hypothetical protein
MGIGGFLKGLFGGGDDGDGAVASQAVQYNGYTIHPTPRRQGGQWLTSGVIRKDFGGETKEHAFIRADTFGSNDEAAAMAVEKGKLIIDERGDRMFG